FCHLCLCSGSKEGANREKSSYLDRGLWRGIRRWPNPTIIGGARAMTPQGDDDGVAAAAAGEGHDFIRLRASDFQRLIVSLSENRSEAGPNSKQPAGQGKLYMAALPVRGQCRPVRIFSELHERCVARSEIDRPAIVGIDQRKVPKFGSLI